MTIRLGKNFRRVAMVNPHGQGSFGWESIGDGDTYEMYFDLYTSDDQGSFATVKVLHTDLDGSQEVIHSKEMGGKQLSLLPRELSVIIQDLSSRGVPPEDVQELSQALEGEIERGLEKKVSLTVAGRK